jgi:hypothetical protein
VAKRDASRRIGRYAIVRELGTGGMATVYLARHLDLDRLVALKELSAVRRGDAAFAQRFLRESRVAGSLSHPNIVTVHDYFQRDGTPYIAMEYVPGGSLRRYVGRELTPAQVGGALGGVLAGLAHAERHGVVHRDLKPENLLVAEDGQVKIADFGIAKASHDARATAALTTTGTTLGTPAYMSPEQAMGEDVGPPSDLYALGIVAFELLVGRVPFGGDTTAPMVVLMRQINDPVPAVRSVRPDVDRALSDWVGRLLVKDPRRRTPSAARAWEELDAALAGRLGPRWRDGAGLVAGARPSAPMMETPVTARAARGGRAARTAPTAATARAPRKARTAQVGSADQRTVAPRATPPTVRASREASRPPWRMIGVLAAALALVGIVLGATRAAPERTADGVGRGTVVSSGALRLTMPTGWRPVRPVPASGLPLADAVAVAPDGRADGTAVVAGMMSTAAAGTTALLPKSYLSSLGLPGDGVPPRTAVTLSEQALPAWRYRDLRPPGSTRGTTLFVVPTSAGVATVACLAPEGATAPDRAACEAVAPTLALRGARPYPTGPSATYASTLKTTLATLHRTTSTHAAALAAAPDRGERARAADALAKDYRRAQRRFAGLSTSPADHAANAKLVSTLRRLAGAYAALARAARHGSPEAERRRQEAVTAAGSVDGALAALRAGGYAGGSSGASGGSGATPAPRPAKPKRTSGCSEDERSDDPSDDAGDCGGEA